MDWPEGPLSQESRGKAAEERWCAKGARARCMLVKLQRHVDMIDMGYVNYGQPR